MAGILTDVPDAAADFSSSAVLPTLQKACAQTGLSSDGAELLRLGENAIFQLAAAPVVVRIARSADRLQRVQRELCVARWLASEAVRELLDRAPTTEQFWLIPTAEVPLTNFVREEILISK